MAGPRAAIVLTLFILPALAGCAEEAPAAGGPRLAQPTWEASIPPSKAWIPPTPDETEPEKPPREFVNLSDPGYVMTAAWQRGDAWHYESNTTPSRYVTRHVTEVRTTRTGGTIYVVEEAIGIVGNDPQSRLRTLYDGENWTRLNARDDLGTEIRFSPAAQGIRFLRNGTFEWNESASGPYGVGWEERHIVNSYFAGYERVLMPWAAVDAARIEHRRITNSPEGSTRELVVRWVDRAYLNDIGFEIDGRELYRLVGVRINGVTQGNLALR